MRRAAYLSVRALSFMPIGGNVPRVSDSRVIAEITLIHPELVLTPTIRAVPETTADLSSAIAAAIATATDRPPGAITPLYEAIDPGALERLFEHAATATIDAASLGLEFTVDDATVVVTGDGTISVYDCGERPLEGGDGSESAFEG